MARRKKVSAEQADCHTAIIQDSAGLWSKLAWDVETFRDIQTSYPNEPEPLCYAAINACITASSLRNWTEEALTREARRRGESFDLHTLLARLQVEVPEQAACEAIANTSKHARPEEGRWPGGEVRLIFQEADEDAPSGYFLQHWNKEGGSEGLALNRFEALCNNWYDLLDSLGLASGMNRIPEWKQRKLRRTFGGAPRAPIAAAFLIPQISEPTEA